MRQRCQLQLTKKCQGLQPSYLSHQSHSMRGVFSHRYNSKNNLYKCVPKYHEGTTKLREILYMTYPIPQYAMGP